MPQTSQPPPPPSSGGNLKYILIGLLFLGAGAIVAWFAAGKEPPAKPPVAAAPPPEPARVNPMAEQNLVLEEEPPPPPPPEPEATPTPTVKRPRGGGGDWECSGEVPQAEALKVVKENQIQIRSCYERRLKVNNILQGDMRLRVKVGAGGRVVATSVSGSLKDPEVFACVRNIASHWTFSTPTGGACAIVDAPFKFSPKQ